MKKLLLSALLSLLGACATSPGPTPVAIYDFGLSRLQDLPDRPLAASTPRFSSSLSIAVRSPAWLETAEIQYRLAYHDIARLYAYAESRWAAPPADLVNQLMKSRIAAVSDVGVVSAREALAAYVLRIELEEFTQVFDAANQSHAMIGLNASLIERKTRSLLAQRRFSAEKPVSTPDAQGAVLALAAASDDVANRVIAWLGEKLPEEKRKAQRRMTEPGLNSI